MSYVTGISGIQLSAASAAYAPTNSADVSAIASSYAESAVSSKLDESATADFYSTSNPSGFVTSSYSPTYGYYNGNISSIDGTGLMGTDTAVVMTNTAQPLANIESGLPFEDTYIFDPPVTAIKITVPDEPGTEPWLNLNADTPEGNLQVLPFAGSDSYYNYSSPEGSGWTSISFDDPNYLSQGGIRYISATGYSDGVTSTAELMQLSASSNFYSTSNPSGFIGSAYVDSAVSSKADSSALSSYALSADVSGTVDLVSTQSANWGGSALALSAGPGVKLEKVGDTLVAGLDETVLWSGSSNTGSMNLLESKNHFQKLNFHLDDATGYNSVYTMDASASYATFTEAMPYPGVTNALLWKYISVFAASDTSFTSIMRGRTIMSASYVDVSTNSTNSLYCTKIVGINRTAEA